LARGLDAQQQIFAGNPDDRRAFEALEEHFFLDGDWPALARIYRDRIAAPSIEGDPVQKGALLFRLGQILEERIVDLDAACDAYWTLARLDRTNRPALRQLRGIHERRGQWDMVLQLAELESATTMPPYERAQFESDLSRIWHRQLGDASEAERAYHRALALDAEFPAALEGLAELCLGSGRRDEAVALLERLTRRLRGPERAPSWLALGRLHAGDPRERAKARGCFDAALEDDPLLTPAVEWSLLLATEDEDWEAVASLLEHRFDLAAGARHRAAIAVEASQIHLHQRGSKAGARAWALRAAELAADEGAVLHARADVERAEGDDDALAGLLERLVQKSTARPPRALLVELAALHARHGRPAKALDALARTPDAATGHDLAVLELRAQCLRETGAKRELAEVLETLVGLEAGQAPALRAQREGELARLCEEDLGDERGAEAHWLAAFSLAPTDAAPLAALERIQRKREDWPALRRTWEAALEAWGDEAPAALCAGLGELLLDRFEAPGPARPLLERALRRDPRHRPALAGLFRVAEQSGDTALELTLCEHEAAACEDPAELVDVARRAIAILTRRGELAPAHGWAVRASDRAPDARAPLEWRADLDASLGLQSDEIATLERLAPLLPGGERCPRLLRKAALELEQGELERAAETLALAVACDPERVETLQALADVERRLGRPTEEARALRAWSERLPPDRRAPPLERLAALLEDPLGDLEAAVAVRWQLVELDPQPAGAARALEALLDLAGRHRELAGLLERERRALGDNAHEVRALDLRRGRLLLDALGDADGAAAIFASLHARDPGDDEVLGLLERALRAGHDAAGLCDLLERRAAWESDAIARAPFALERAQLLEEVLGQPHAACDVYASILETAPGSAAAVLARARLESLCEATGQWARLHQLLVARVADLPDAERTPLRERIAEICRDQLQDPAGCAAQLEAIAAAHPERVPVWQRLQDLYTRVLDRPDEWLRVAQAELASVPTPRRELALRVAIGRLLLDGARRPRDRSARDAIGHYERAHQLDPSHAEAAELLVGHYQRAERPADVARVLEAHLACLDDARSAERDDLRLRLARVWSEELGDAVRARGLLETVHASRGAVPEVAEPLAAILEGAADPDAARSLAELARDSIRLRASERERFVWRVRLGGAATRLGLLDEAGEAYRAALAQAPGDRALEDALAANYEQRGEREPLVELLERRIAQVDPEAERALRLRVVRLCADAPEHAARTLAHLERLLDLEPESREVLDRYLALTARLDDPQQVRRMLDRALALPLAAPTRVACLERRAALAGSEPAAAEQAIRDLRDALGLAPSNGRLRLALRERLTALARWPAVLDCLALEAEAADGAARCDLLEEGAALARAQLGPDAELPWLARLRAERPDDAALWERLATLHEQAGRHEAALRALDEELARRPDPTARLAIQRRRAALLERRLAAPGRAVLALQAALALAPDDGEILAELDRLLASLARPLERAAILERRVAPLAGRDGLPLRRTLAELYCVDLAKPESALAHLRANVDATRDVPEEELHHLGHLATALRACGREDEWAGVAERELGLMAAHPELRAHTPVDYQRFLREEIARILDRVLGDPERALERIEELCDDPILAGDGVQPRVRDRLHDLLRRTGRTGELARRLAQALDAGHGSARDWLELAGLRERTQSRWALAADAYREAGRDPRLRLESIQGRRRCAEALRDDAALAEALRDALAHEPPLPPDERKSLARALGDVSWPGLAAPDEAVRAYRLALELDPRDPEVLAAWIAVLAAQGRHDETVELHRRALALTGDDPEQRAHRRAIQLRLAALLGRRDGDLQDAIAAYRDAESIERLSAADERALATLHARAGDERAHAEILGRWCDREDSPAQVADHLELARRLADAGERAQALARVERAVALAPEHAPAWALLGRLQRESGRADEALAAFERAASHALPIEAARHRVEAAAVAEPSDLERAHALLARAVRDDATSFAANAAMTRVASRLGRDADSVRHAERALELAAGHSETTETRLELALLGARAARKLDQADACLRLFRVAHALEPELVEALEGLADAEFAQGELQAARALLERRLAADPDEPGRPRPLWMIGCALEQAGDLAGACARFEQALALDPGFDEAHERLVRSEERAARPDRARAALERWADASRDPVQRARAAFRAAEHALAAGDPETARQRLELATREDPDQGDAWVLLCGLAAEHAGESETRRICEAALAVVAPGTQSARIALRLARLAEVAGDRAEAARRYGEAWRWDPRCSEAALCESRLARMAGDWLEADGVLARFLEAHPDPGSASLAQVHLERGRLLAGPLEAFDAAIDAYQHALALQPGLAVARSALAGLLLHAPARKREALALHREILNQAPTTAASLRALGTLAERQDQPDVAKATRALLDALGLATPQERAEAPAMLGIALRAGPPLPSVEDERLRRLAHPLRDELAGILGALPASSAASPPSAAGLPIDEILALEDELGAPGLTRLPPDERRSLFLALAGLFLDPGGNGGDSRFRDPLDRALGIWTRRKLRRIAEETRLDAISGLDHGAWGHEVRALAAAQLLDREHHGLRAILLALIALDGGADPDLDPVELGGVAASCEPARRLLARIANALCERLERGR